jgi:hypothetical protein
VKASRLAIGGAILAAILVVGYLLGLRRAVPIAPVDDERAAPVAPVDELAALEGVWESDRTERHLVARRSGNEVTFHVVEPAEWTALYEDDEIRVRVWPTKTPGVFALEERVRPEPPHARRGRTRNEIEASCVATVSGEVAGRPLVARATDRDTLQLTLAKVEFHVDFDEVRNVSSCRVGRTLGTIHSTLRRR